MLFMLAGSGPLKGTAKSRDREFGVEWKGRRSEVLSTPLILEFDVWSIVVAFRRKQPH